MEALEIFLAFLKAFAVGGLICAIAQLVINFTDLTAGKILVIFMLAGIALILVAGLAEIPLWLRLVLIAIAALVAVGGIALACVIDREAGVFECPACGKQFVPTMKAYIKGIHTLRKRRLACPHCGKTSWCRRIARRE